ncbi:MAG: hypothetical protein ACRCW9_06455 [Cetobacterium sp.]
MELIELIKLINESEGRFIRTHRIRGEFLKSENKGGYVYIWIKHKEKNLIEEYKYKIKK